MVAFNEENKENRVKIKKLASAGPLPEELKEPVNLESPKEVISYNGNIYALRYQELRNLGLEYCDDIVSLSAERGLDDPAFFSRACHYCDNANFTIFDIFDMVMKTQEVTIVNNTEDINWGCNYKPDFDLSVAVVFSSKDEKQEPFYALQNRCAFDDSLVTYLADNGHLDKYRLDELNEVSKELISKFKPINTFNKDIEIPEEFLIGNISQIVFGEKPKSNKKKSLLKRLFGK